MDKLKIFSKECFFPEVVEEQLFLFGKINNEIINKNKTFRDLKKEDILNLIEYTDVENCDFICYPKKINKQNNINDLIELSQKYNKKILLFYNDDDDTEFNFDNSIIFRTSIYKTKKPKNYSSVPAFCNDLKKESIYSFRSKNEIPTIGFCGAITHRYRQIIIDEISNSKKLKTNFLIRNNFWGGKIWDNQVRQDYINNILSSDFIICVRGAGNFSYRFYETLCMGRIPLVLDTDISFPFEDYINYDEKILKIKVEDLQNVEKLIYSFWDKIDDLEKYQKDLISFWENHLSPVGFIKTLNKYKNEINKLLY
jgi:hypothetical protein